MNRFLILILVNIIFRLNLQAQYNENLYTIRLDNVVFKGHYKAAVDLQKHLTEKLAESYNLKRKATIVVKPVINTGTTGLIEGMDIKAVGKPQLEIKVTDLNTRKDSTYVFSKELDAATTTLLGVKLVEAFIISKEAIAELDLFLQSFIAMEFEQKCDARLANVKAMQSRKEYNKALLSLVNLIPSSSCKEKALSLQKEILDLQAQLNCTEKLHQARIMVNSGVSFQMSRAVNILLSISPDAPCAQEALDISIELGNKMEGQPKTTTHISRYQNSHANHKENWRLLYIERILD